MTGDITTRPSAGGLIGRDRLTADLRSLGMRRGQDLLIHCSLRRVGRIDGGPATLLSALRDVAGPQATLVVPTQTTLNSLTSAAFLSATADLDAQERIRYVAAMPGFNPKTTPSAGMGMLAEHLRTRPDACRSSHPQVSFAALGPGATACTAVHDLECHLGNQSPLGWLYEVGAAVLLLGVGYGACTAFHLAEYRLPGVPPLKSYRCFTDESGMRVERKFTDLALDDSDFELLGAAMESAIAPGATPALRRGQVGSARCRLVSLRSAVDFACSWLKDHRGRMKS